MHLFIASVPVAPAAAAPWSGASTLTMRGRCRRCARWPAQRQEAMEPCATVATRTDIFLHVNRRGTRVSRWGTWHQVRPAAASDTDSSGGGDRCKPG